MRVIQSDQCHAVACWFKFDERVVSVGVATAGSMVPKSVLISDLEKLCTMKGTVDW